MSTTGFLGIDAGTQGLSVVFTDAQLNVLATGEGGYEMIPDLAEGCYEQDAGDWERALRVAMEELRKALDGTEIDVLSIGISGQMHGEVLADERGELLAPVRLWCDSRNEAEGNELTERFGVKMPKRITTARWLWTIRNKPELAKSVSHITTPAGWLAYRLTGEWSLGVGDAAGMFPIDQQSMSYDSELLSSFDELTREYEIRPLGTLLPQVRCAGQEAGGLNESGAELLKLSVGIPVAPAEGDQPASLAGALIGDAGMVSISFGTSVCANSVGDRAFQGVSDGVDHFCAPDGKPINMVWLRNGTTFMNTVVEMFGSACGGGRNEGFEKVMPELLSADPDCGGLMALPFMDDEPGLGVGRGGTAMVIGLNPGNSSAGNVVKAALLSTMFNLKMGSEELDRQGFPRTELVLAGGLTKTPATGQILADVFDTRVTLLESAEEGTAWGAAVMAKYRHQILSGDALETLDWGKFLAELSTASTTSFTPNPKSVARYELGYQKYKRLLSLQASLESLV